MLQDSPHSKPHYLPCQVEGCQNLGAYCREGKSLVSRIGTRQLLGWLCSRVSQVMNHLLKTESNVHRTTLQPFRMVARWVCKATTWGGWLCRVVPQLAILQGWLWGVFAKQPLNPGWLWGGSTMQSPTPGGSEGGAADITFFFLGCELRVALGVALQTDMSFFQDMSRVVQ